MGKAIGIDLGTTYSAVSIISETGSPEILLNQDGEKLTPSVVFFQSFDGQDEPLVGIQAKNLAATQPLNTVQYVKRQMGDPNWQFDSMSDVSYSAEEISAIILKRLKEGAENALGEEVTDAVITVPAYFDDARRLATKQAGQIAGLNVLRVLNEPTAAALAYGITGDKNETVLVYDLGGGIFDVTLIRINNGEFDVLGTDGDRNLGGFDFDNALAMLIATKMEEQGAEGVINDVEFAGMLREKSEATKRSLTTVAQANAFIDYQGKPYKVSISREEFEAETNLLVKRTEEILDDVLDEAGLTFEQVDHVLLIGGSTRMPMIHKMLEKKVGRPISYSINPDEAVASGAALQAYLEISKENNSEQSVASTSLLPEFRISDVTSQGLGTFAQSSETGQLFNSIIIPKNSKIPCQFTEIYGTVVDNQSQVNIEVTQGDDTDVDFVTKIGESTIALPPGPKGSAVKVTFHYDIDQIIFVEVHDKDDQLLGTFEIDRSANMDKSQLLAAEKKIQSLAVD